MTDWSSSISCIYGLTDPVTGEVRYVGKTVRPVGTRVNEHMRRSNQPPNRRGKYTRLNVWIKSLEAPPGLVVLEDEPPNLNGAEIHWINELRAAGRQLLNMTAGGDGGRRGRGRTRTKSSRPLGMGM